MEQSHLTWNKYTDCCKWEFYVTSPLIRVPVVFPNLKCIGLFNENLCTIISTQTGKFFLYFLIFYLFHIFFNILFSGNVLGKYSYSFHWNYELLVESNVKGNSILIANYGNFCFIFMYLLILSLN